MTITPVQHGFVPPAIGPAVEGQSEPGQTEARPGFAALLKPAPEAPAGSPATGTGRGAGPMALLTATPGQVVNAVELARMAREENAALARDLAAALAEAGLATDGAVALRVESDGRVLAEGAEGGRIEAILNGGDGRLAARLRRAATLNDWTAELELAGRYTARWRTCTDEAGRDAVVGQYEGLFKQLGGMGGRLTLTPTSLSAASHDFVAGLA